MIMDVIQTDGIEVLKLVLSNVPIWLFTINIKVWYLVLSNKDQIILSVGIVLQRILAVIRLSGLSDGYLQQL